ncbi:MAG: helix-turn-helix domain-containing protein [Candidatus Thermoplasmatota archaeon]|nr:helix-turn-helix domain-containing protein [Candidatus Thermoplasmatota archaeon]
MIKELRNNGMSISSIAKRLGICRATVRKYLSCVNPPVYHRTKKASILDPYKPYIKERIEKYDLSAVRILDEIKEKGILTNIQSLKDINTSGKNPNAINGRYSNGVYSYHL